MLLLLTTPAIAEPPQPAGVPPATPWMPSQAEVAALGTVLCTWRRSYGSELRCLQRSCIGRSCVNVSPAGVSEWIAFLTPEGHCCMRLHPLPEATRRPAWNRLLERLPGECQLPSPGDGCLRMLQRMGDWLRGEDWKSSALAFLDGRNPAATFAALGGGDAAAAQRILASLAAPPLQ